MDKLAVVVEEDLIKSAMSGAPTCPSCGSRRVDTRSLTPVCPNCGTKPWEPHAAKKTEVPRRR